MLGRDKRLHHNSLSFQVSLPLGPPVKLVRKYLILSHRYLGIAMCLLAVMWFVTGITMMYVGGMPQLTPERRLDRMPTLDLSQIKLTPAEAAARAASKEGGQRGPGTAGRVVLLSAMGRPAYRVGARTIFADTGEVMEELTLEQSRNAASRFINLPENKVRHIETLNHVDQWTLLQARQMPLYRFAVDDGHGTELYIQPQSGEVVVMTTRRSRAMAWISTIPHWLYFTALRKHQSAWYETVVWGSAFVCASAVIGMILAFVQWRRTKPLRLSRSIPYAGWKRWHYITGAIFGIFTITWTFSGLLSMEPFDWTRAPDLEIQRDVFTGGPVDLKKFPIMDPARWDEIMGGHPIKEVEFARIQGDHYYVIRSSGDRVVEKKRERLHQPYNITGRRENSRLLVSAANLEIRRQPFSVESLVARLKKAVPETPIVEQQLLTNYDSYYYSRGGNLPLPVLRVKFADPMKTWVYVDPVMSQLLASVHKYSRVERWLYNGLHSLDFSFWYNKRPLWDVGMIVLLLGGLASSSLGVVLGLKRLRRVMSGPKALAPLSKEAELVGSVPR